MLNSEFRSELEKLIGKETKQRPFVCDGFPLKCEIFIIGINPATSMDSNFFDFWNDAGFNKEKWFNQYKKERRAKGKREISPTRRKIDMLVNEVFTGYNCLETNAYMTATPDVNSLKKDDKNTDILAFLIKTIKPKALFIHGSDPADFIKEELNIKFPSSKPIVVNYQTEKIISPLVYEWDYGKMAICATKHLRLTKKEEIIECAEGLVSQIKKLK